MISVSVWCFKSFYRKQNPEHVETQPRGLATRDLWQEKKSKKKNQSNVNAVKTAHFIKCSVR